MRNLRFVHYSAVLLGLVVLRTKAQNGFCSMCTKGCYTVLTRPNPFWGQFWGQICKTDSHTHQSNKCAAFVSLRKADTSITEFPRRKSPTNQYISFTLQQEVARKHYSTTSPHTAPVTARNAPVWAHSQSHRRDTRPAIYRPKSPASEAFAQERLFLCRLCPDGFRLYRKSLHK